MTHESTYAGPDLPELTRDQAKQAVAHLQDIHQLHDEEAALRLLLDAMDERTEEFVESLTLTLIAQIMYQNGLTEARLSVDEVVRGDAHKVNVSMSTPGVIHYVLEEKGA